MTDNEIKKALECCTYSLGVMCKKCPSKTTLQGLGCRNKLSIATLGLINRQKAKIERLQDYNENLQTANTALSNEILEIKSEAIKEFAERLKCGVPQETGVIRCADVDNLVKEMTEVQK